MSKKLYVGNLSYKCTDNELSELFETYGKVESARIITDRETGRSKGFGFVEMERDEDAAKAVDELNNREFIGGRPLTVNIARPRDNNTGFNKRDNYNRDNYNNRRG